MKVSFSKLPSLERVFILMPSSSQHESGLFISFLRYAVTFELIADVLGLRFQHSVTKFLLRGCSGTSLSTRCPL